MITLQFKRRHSELKVGDTIHLKVIGRETIAPGKWRLIVDDVTPDPPPKIGSWRAANMDIVECTPEKPCCDRQGEYNGFGSDGPLKFTCPKHCSCHD